jgi:hypothetical protein
LQTAKLETLLIPNIFEKEYKSVGRCLKSKWGEIIDFMEVTLGMAKFGVRGQRL